MKRIPKIIFILSILVSRSALAQTDSAEQKTTFKLGINYNSGLNYYGRTDSLKSTGFFPMAELWFSKEVYINAAPVFVNNAVQSFVYAGTVASFGYLHTTKGSITNLYLTKPFYKQSSALVQSALKAQAGVSYTFLRKVLNVTLGSDAKLSDKMDFGATAGLDHLIKKQFKNNDVLVIDPSFYAYAGTQNFSNTYTKRKAGVLLFPGGSEQVTENVKQFNILAYEVSVPVVYVKGKWMALLTPSYIIPQHLITVPNRPDLSETGQKMFYATAGIKYSF